MGQPEELAPIIKPEMKLYGAGISTLMSRIVMLLIFVGVFVFKDKYAIY
jgi:Na+-driven multidrug efflux pump